MKFLVRLCCLVVYILSSQQAWARDEIEIATLNQYLGADLTPVLAAEPEAFNGALVAVLTQVASSDFPARVQAQARAIAKQSPKIMGLQEVWNLSCADGDPDDHQGCQDPAIANAFGDHLALTLAALNDIGTPYHAAAIVKNLDLGQIDLGFGPGIPFEINGVGALLVAIDRDVILARDGVDTQVVDLTSVCSKPSEDGCNYAVVVPASTPVGNIPIERGFVAVDTTIGGRDYRIFNTHLELTGEELNPLLPSLTIFQAEQAYELIHTAKFLTPVDRTLLVIGDMNSFPEQENVPGPPPFPAPNFDTLIITPYKQFTDPDYNGEYADIWALRPGNVPGYTCCQTADLTNKQTNMDVRIDMIFSWENPAKVKQARVLSDKVSSKTNPPGQGLWPSDHGGIGALIQY